MQYNLKQCQKMNKYCLINMTNNFNGAIAKYIKEAKETVKNTKVKTKAQLHAIYDLPIVRNKDGIASLYVEYNYKIQEVLVDDEDYHRMLCCDAILMIGAYVYVIKYNYQFAMHRFVLNYEGPKDVDHIFNNTCDNRKASLRLATREENLYNRRHKCGKTSKYIGVFNLKAIVGGNKDVYSTAIWRANIEYNYQQIIIGDFDIEANAGKARDMATVKYYKEFGKLNFPVDIEEYNLNQEDSLYIKYMDKLLPANTHYVMETDIRMIQTRSEKFLAEDRITEVDIARVAAINAQKAADYALKSTFRSIAREAANKMQSRTFQAELDAMSLEELLASFPK